MPTDVHSQVSCCRCPVCSSSSSCSWHPTFQLLGLMARYTYLAALVLLGICCQWGSSAAMAMPDEERYVRKEYNRDLLDWFNNVGVGVGQFSPGQVATLCRYPLILENSLGAAMPIRKRNSELINSLLSLPKNMNDAGK
ncbi:protein PDF [Drosophila santomea]|uniref:protein PDF n=1 Tax=Drosophila santomea TaxID=129105 RepID=UPI001954626B|nr:protein PDF [Drosophila santomea]